MEHTKEPWPAPEYDNADCSNAEWWELPGIGRIYGEANARRIVACVNACASIPTEALETVGVASLNAKAHVDKSFNEVVRQRDELLAALESAVEAIRLFRNEPQLERLISLRATAGYVAMDAAMDRGNAAIAKVKP